MKSLLNKALAGLSVGLSTIFFSSYAFAALTFSIVVPTQSTDGNYTLTWSQSGSGGCSSAQYTYGYAKQIQEYKNGQLVQTWAAGSVPSSFSGKTNGVYTYNLVGEDMQFNPSTGQWIPINCGVVAVDTVTVSIPQPPAVPTSISAPGGIEYDGQYTVSWAGVSGSTSYELLERSNGGSGWSAWATIHNAAGTSKSRSGLTPASWQYAVRACNAAGCSGWRYSSVVTVSAPPSPPAASVPGSTEYDGNYTVGIPNTAYTVQYLEQKYDGSTWQNTTSVFNTTSAINWSRPSNGPGTYRYLVRNHHGTTGQSAWASSSNVVVAAPSVPTAVNVAGGFNYSGDYTLNWQPSTGATKYTVQERELLESGWSDWVTRQDNSAVSLPRYDMDIGTYQYQVKACATVTGCSDWVASNNVIVSKPGMPSSFSPSSNITSNTASANLSWASVSGAASYELRERSNSGSGWSTWATIQDSPATSMARTGLAVNDYQYQVRACSDTGCSDWNTSAVVTVEVGSIISSEHPSYDGTFTVSWNPAAYCYGDLQADGHETCYEILLNGGLVASNTSGLTSLNYTDLPEGTYTFEKKYRYSAYPSIQYEYIDSAITVLVLPPLIPADLPITVSSNDQYGNFNLSWPSHPDAETYKLEVSTDGVNYSPLQNNFNTSYSVTGKSEVSTFYYRVDICNVVGDCTESPGPVKTVIVDYPTPGIVSSVLAPIATTSDSIEVNWLPASGTLTHYKIEIDNNGQVSYDTTGPTENYYTITNLNAGQVTIRVAGCNVSDDCNEWSDPVTTAIDDVPILSSVPDMTGGVATDNGTGLSDFNGAVGGSLSVAPSGAAIYSIPLQLPQGTGGMTPSLALAYNSSASDGVLGKAWSLVGLSGVVSRCAKNTAQDGIIADIDLSASDALCLNGARLVPISTGSDINGTYTEYRIELDGFQRIRSYGSGGSYDEFIVWQQNGSKLYFGGNSASINNTEGAGEVTVRWLLHTVEDVYGNQTEVSYEIDAAPLRDIRMKEVLYGANASSSQSHYAKVVMNYSDAFKVISGYQFGDEFAIKKRMDSVSVQVMKVGESTWSDVREYVLEYDHGGLPDLDSGVSQLTAVDLCAPNASGTCTGNPVTFDWVDETSGFTVSTWERPVGNGNTINHWLDMNGDGKTDFVTSLAASGDFFVSLSDGSNFSSTQTWVAVDRGSQGSESLTDMDGDGLLDYITTESNGVHKVAISYGSGFNSPADWTTPAYDFPDYLPEQRFYLDVNGDSLSDLVMLDTTGIKIHLSTGTAFSAVQNWGGPNLVPYVDETPEHLAESFTFQDVNIDGLVDVVVINMNPDEFVVYMNNGNGFDAGTSYSSLINDSSGLWVDMNKDGYIDYVTGTSIYFWTGEGYVRESFGGSIGDTMMRALHDMNGDGYPDIITADKTATTYNYTVWFTDGNSPVSAQNLSGPVFDGALDIYYFIDANADGRIDVAVLEDDGDVRMGINQNQPVELIHTITDGLGNVTTIDYKPLSDTSVHTKLNDASYPVIDMASAAYVVANINQPDGIGDTSTTHYHYEGFKLDMSGRGSLGFKKVYTEIPSQKVRSVTEYYQDFPYIGLVKSTQTYVTDVNDNDNYNDQQLLSSSAITYTAYDGVTQTSGPDIQYVCLNTQTTQQYDLAGTLLSTTVSDNDPNSTGACDAYGSNLVNSVSVKDHIQTPAMEYRTITTQVVTHDTSNWFIGQVDNLQVQNLTGPIGNLVGDASTDREVSYTYNAQGHLATTIREPNQGPGIKLTSSYDYDSSGNLTGETITPSDVGAVARTETVTYDARGRFPVTLTNAAGHSSTLSYNELLGVVTSMQGPNTSIAATTRTFDAFGRQLSQNRPDGTVEAVSYKSVSAGAIGTADLPPNHVPVIMVESTVSDGISSQFAPVRTYLDSLGRTLRTRTRAFDAVNFLHQDVEYDNRGRIKSSSLSYFEGDMPQWNTPSYDVLGRNIGIVAADSTQNGTILYDSFTVTTRDAANRERSVVSNALGQPIRTYEVDEGGSGLAIIDYKYNVAGQLVETAKLTLGSESEITKTVASYTYDRLGRRTSSTDPDMGVVTYTYNSLSEVKAQQTPKLFNANRAIEMDYDILGRLIERRDPTGDLLGTITSYFDFDDTTGGNAGIGRLTSETLNGGGQPAFSRSYFYNGSEGGAVTSVDTTIGTDTYNVSNTYDNLGRVNNVTYPETSSYPSGNRYEVTYHYNPRGYLERVTNNQNTDVMYQVVNVNGLGQIDQAWMGDTSLTTNIFAEGSGRLLNTSAARDNSGSEVIQSFAYDYDGLGNMTMRSDLLRNLSETFTYDEHSRITSATVTNSGGAQPAVNFEYDEYGNLTHKSDVTSLLSASMGYSNIDAGAHALTSLNDGVTTHQFTYDDNGNLLTGDADGNGRSISWTSFDKPSVITQGAVTRSFAYGPDNRRYQQVHNDGSGDVITHYIGDLYTRSDLVGGEIEHKLTVFAGGHAIAIVVDNDDAGTLSTDTRYLHRDHLGSITAIVDSAGIEALSYDVFGNRRSATDWASAAGSVSEERGYTGHEHLDDVNLIHMNGRIMDPVMARFASADPILQAPFNSQNYNRYSYVLNNPLKYTDPSGYQIFERNTIYSPVGIPVDYYPAVDPTFIELAPAPSQEGLTDASITGGSIIGNSLRDTSTHNPVTVTNPQLVNKVQIESPPLPMPEDPDIGSQEGDEESESESSSNYADSIASMNAMNVLNGILDSYRQAGVALAEAANRSAMMMSLASACMANPNCGNFGIDWPNANVGSVGSFNGGSNNWVLASNVNASVSAGSRVAVHGVNRALNSTANWFSSKWKGVKFGFNAVRNGMSEDFESGGWRGWAIGFTGGRSNQSFGEQLLSNYSSTSIVYGNIKDIDKKVVSLVFASSMTKRYGGYSLGQWILNGKAPHLPTHMQTGRLVATTSIVNGTAITVSWEVGNGIGALVRTWFNRKLTGD